MGNYITQAMLEARVGEASLAKFLAQPVDTAGYAAEAARVIARAEAAVDAVLSERFTTPVTSTGLLEELSLALAEWEVYRRGAGAVPEKIRQARDDAYTILQKIGDGKMGTGSATTPTAASDAGGLVVDGADALYDPDSMDDADW